MKLLVAGCGDLGTELGLLAAEAGHRVVGLRRHAEVLPDGIEALAADLTSPALALPGDLDTVAITTAPDSREPEAYRRAYLTAPENLARALAAAGVRPKRVVMVSSTGVYGVEDGSWVDEDTSAEPGSATGGVLLEAEEAFRQLWPQTGVVLRLAGVYGPGRTRLIESVRRGEVTGEPQTHTNRIHRDDAAAALLHLLLLDDPEPYYLGVDDAPAPRGEVTAFLADELGVPPPAHAGARSRRGGDKRLSNRRLVTSGFALRYPTYREGYRAVLAGSGRRHP